MKVSTYNTFKITKYEGSPHDNTIHEALFVGHDSGHKQYQPPGFPEDEHIFNAKVAHACAAHLQKFFFNVWVYERWVSGSKGWNPMIEHLNETHKTRPVMLHNMLHFDDVGDSGVSGTKCLYWHNSTHGTHAAHVFARKNGIALNLPSVGWDGKGGGALQGVRPGFPYGDNAWWMVYKGKMPSIITEHACVSTAIDAEHLIKYRDRLPYAHLQALDEYLIPF